MHKNNNIFLPENRGVIWIKPNLPSLRRIAANKIDPSKGASTWALGSHKCNPNKGIFTKKAKILPKIKNKFEFLPSLVIIFIK